MSVVNLLKAFFEYLPLLLAAIMCIMPIREKCRINVKILLAILLGVLTALSAVFAVMQVEFSVNPHLLLLPGTVLILGACLMMFKADIKKLWYIFWSDMALLSFAGALGYTVEAYVKGKGSAVDLPTVGLAVEWILAVVCMVFSILTLPKVKWLTEQSCLEGLWKCIWIVPVLVIITNLLMLPYDYSKASNARLFEILISELVLLLLFLLFQVMLYFIAKTVTDRAEAEKRSQLMSIQAAEYNILKKYIEDTGRLRHDFKHLARTAAELAEIGDTQSLVKLLNEHLNKVQSSHTQKLFCTHNALNAIIAYYYDEAVAQGIACDWKVSISAAVGIPDVELCSLMGNLIDNAIQGCLTLSENRRISINADTEKNGDIYIVVTNSFDGYIKKENNKYKTTKATGSGIGLDSVTATVKKYNGFVRFYNDSQCFYTDIMLKPQ